jgi:hypothetical protein
MLSKHAIWHLSVCVAVHTCRLKIQSCFLHEVQLQMLSDKYSTLPE